MSEICIFEMEERKSDPLKDYANRLFSLAVTGANATRALNQGELPKQIWLSIVFEYLFFYITVTDREGLKALPAGERMKLTTRLVDVLMTRVVNEVFEGNGAAVERYKAVAAERLQEYEKFDSTLRGDSERRFEGSALGAFCSRVSKLAAHPDDMMHVMTAHAHIHDSLLFLRLDEVKQVFAMMDR